MEEAQKIRDHFLAISTLKTPRRQQVHLEPFLNLF